MRKDLLRMWEQTHKSLLSEIESSYYEAMANRGGIKSVPRGVLPPTKWMNKENQLHSHDSSSLDEGDSHGGPENEPLIPAGKSRSNHPQLNSHQEGAPSDSTPARSSSNIREHGRQNAGAVVPFEVEAGRSSLRASESSSHPSSQQAHNDRRGWKETAKTVAKYGGLPAAGAVVGGLVASAPAYWNAAEARKAAQAAQKSADATQKQADAAQKQAEARQNATAKAAPNVQTKTQKGGN